MQQLVWHQYSNLVKYHCYFVVISKCKIFNEIYLAKHFLSHRAIYVQEVSITVQENSSRLSCQFSNEKHMWAEMLLSYDFNRNQEYLCTTHTSSKHTLLLLFRILLKIWWPVVSSLSSHPFLFCELWWAEWKAKGWVLYESVMWRALIWSLQRCRLKHWMQFSLNLTNTLCS